MFEEAVICGKFIPFHKGHELLFDTAKALGVRKLYVVIGVENSTIPVDVRKKWIREYTTLPIEFIPDKVFSSQEETDVNGTIISQVWWNNWTNYVKEFVNTGEKVCVISSDLYGKEIARRLDCQWVPVDPERFNYPIRGSVIMQDLRANWNMLSDKAKPYFTKRIAFLGPESSGKTTLVQTLQKLPNVSCVHEWGRTVDVYKGDLTKEDFSRIFAMQNMFINKFSDTPYLISDTEAITTFIFYKIFFGDNEEVEKLKDYYVQQNDIYCYILLKPSIPFVDDGTRVTQYLDRDLIFEELLAEVKKTGKKYIVTTVEDILK